MNAARAAAALPIQPAPADGAIGAGDGLALAGPAASPFAPEAGDAYRRWRDAKLARYPRRAEDLIVEVRDPRRLSAAEHAAVADRIGRANMAIYAGPDLGPDPEIPKRLGAQFGLHRLDTNWLADDDGVSRLQVAAGQPTRGEYIPYTDRPIRWHTDGYYHPPARRIEAMVLHCVQDAWRGGDNALLDHEIAYLLLRERDPALVRALMAEDAMTIPAREDESGVARPAQSGPVFVVSPATGRLAMRYTARSRSIQWKEDAATQRAVAALAEILEHSSHVLRAHLAPGWGLICNNVLHDRAGFTDLPERPRLLYRARFLDGIAAA